MPTDPPPLPAALRLLLHDVGAFSRVVQPAHRLRGYLREPARAIAESVSHGLGRQFAVVFARQAGKDEMLAQLIAWLLTRNQRSGGGVVLAAPTMTQALVSRDRLTARLRGSPLTIGRLREREGYIVGVGNASARFLSGPLMDARVRTIADGVAPAQYGRREAGRVKQALREFGPVTVPREFVFMDRAAIGLGGVFLHLKAEMNFHRLFEDAIRDFSVDKVAARQAVVLSLAGLPAAA